MFDETEFQLDMHISCTCYFKETFVFYIHAEHLTCSEHKI